MTSLIVFDLDGTLVDTPRVIVETFTTALAGMGARAQDEAAIRATIGLPLEQAFGRLLGVAPGHASVAQGISRYQLEFKERVLPRARTLIFPGVEQGLAALRREGLILAVATSKFYASADALLKAAGLRDHFRVLVGADQVKRPKPHPESGELILRSLAIHPERAVMVGDTTHDLLMAKAAGMRSVAVTYGVHGIRELRCSQPTWIADSFDEALACILRELRRA